METPSDLRERSHELPSYSSGQKEEEFHEEVRKSPQGDSERSKHTILTDGVVQIKEHLLMDACIVKEYLLLVTWRSYLEMLLQAKVLMNMKRRPCSR